MNQILKDQNKEDFLRLLKAQRIAYSYAKMYQVIDILSILIAIVPPFLLLFNLNHANLFAVIGVGWTILSIFSDVWRKQETKVGAIIQEEFDTRLFKIEWNSILVGIKMDTDKIISLSKKYKKNDLCDWYSTSIKEQLPHPIAVLLCFKHNSIWGKQQRKKYSNSMIWIIGIYYGLMVLLCIYKNTGLFDFAVWIAPSIPFLVYGISTIKNQGEIIKEYTRIGITVDNSIEADKSN